MRHPALARSLYLTATVTPHGEVRHGNVHSGDRLDVQLRREGRYPLIHQDDDRGRLKLLRMSHSEAKGCWLRTEFRRL